MDAGPFYKKPALAVARAGAEALVRALHEVRALDATRRIETKDGEVWIPVRADADFAALALAHRARLVDAPGATAREPRRPPREQVRALLRDRFGDALLDAVPDKWEQHGDVLVLRVPDAWLPEARALGEAFARAMDLKTVLHDPVGVSGELREMRAVPIFGDDPLALHVENGVRYRFDASRVMFSSGNLHERVRTARIACAGETIVDMFAGIGYFTLPLAVHAMPARIHALEKNPVSFRHLVENVALNAVGDIVQPWMGDNRAFPGEGIADRVLMGYFPHTEAFLPKALALVKPGGRIHFHNTAHAERWREELVGQVRAVAPTATIEEARVVKTFSPGVVHAIVVARL